MRRLAALLLLFLSLTAGAQEVPVTLDQIHHPSLLVKTAQPGVFLPAPSVRTDIALTIRGIVARGVVRQTFENPSDRCVEALYVFPLADDATIDAMRLKVGVRTITGEIRERKEAQQVYEQARSEGRKASLLEQHRPNLFTVSVASLGAGERAEIELEYQQIVAWEDRFALRVPLAIAPRYVAANSGPLPQIRHEIPHPQRNPVTIEIDLDAGIPLQTITSPTHALDQIPTSGTAVRLKPRDVQLASDRDFELVWTPRLGAQPQRVAFSETAGGHRYTLVMLFPPAIAGQAALPRETIYIIDTSGSMGTGPMEQAKQALLTAIGRLRASDRFNVIEFDDSATQLFDDSRPADPANIKEALEWVQKLQSDGGTEMLGALQLALNGETSDVVRQVVFITDGQVGNEAEIFDYIRQHRGSSRVFTIGIGSAPNSFFMRNAARTGRGTFTHIGDLGEVESKMTAMFRKLESPVLTNIALQVDSNVEAWPREVPDLYAGEPLVMTLRGPATANASRLGRIAATGWNDTIAATPQEAPRGLAKLWARQKIDVLRDSVFSGANAEEVRAQIVALGLEHHLVTEHTSLVAVDTTPPDVDAKSCTSELVPVNLPAGWGGIDGALPKGGTSARLWLLAGALLLATAWVTRS